MKRIALLAIASALLAGCASEGLKRHDAFQAWKQTLPEANADYGSFPEKHQEAIKSYLARTLKDPDSAKYSEFTAPKKGYAVVASSINKAIYGYSVCGYVNAKNSYGGYTGNHMFWFFINNGKVVLSQDMSSGNFLRLIYEDDLTKCLDYDNSVR